MLDSVSPKVIAITSADSEHVLIRRLKYAKQYADGALKSQQGNPSRYGSRFSFEMPTAASILQCFVDSLRSRGGREIVQLFESASNSNTRAMLDLVKKYLTSKYLDTRIIADNYRSNASYRIRVFQVVRTLMLGDSVHYDPVASPFCNLFDIQRANPLEHFTRFTALHFLLAVAESQPQQAYARVSDVVSHLCKVGYTASHAGLTVKYLFERKCIESRNPIEDWSDEVADICISQLGRYHISQLIYQFNYLDAVSIDTPIIDEKARADIRDVHRLIDRLQRCVAFVEYLNKCADAMLDSATRTLWRSVYTHAMESMAVIQDQALADADEDNVI